VWLPHVLPKSREIDSMSPVARFDTAQNHGFPIGGVSAGFATLYKCPPIPRKIGFPSSFAGFLPWLGVRRR
jgi:hypothetical protein